jgi:hypothetical protein
MVMHRISVLCLLTSASYLMHVALHGRDSFGVCLCLEVTESLANFDVIEEEINA